MEESILSILQGLSTKIKTLSECAHNVTDRLTNEVNDSTLQEGRVVSSKLHTYLQRLERELNNYFRHVNVPAVDEVSAISTIQLEAEENLCELKVKIETYENSMINSCKNEERTLSGKLPKLELPQFEGNVLDWYQFWDQFSSNIHKRNLPDVDKLLYLKASLKGEAKGVIDGLDTTNKNYSIAVQSLKDRYGKQSQVIDAHYSSLYKINPADKTVADCRRVFTYIERHLRVLSSMGENINHNHLRFLVMGKFPEDIIYEMKLKLKQDSIEEIRKYLEIIISAREDANRLTQEKNLNEREYYTVKTLHSIGNNDTTNPIKNHSQRRQEKTNYETNKGKIRNQLTQNKRYTSQKNIGIKQKYTSCFGKTKGKEGPPRKKPKICCIFCNESHYNDECSKFKEIKERKSLLKNRCYRCFQQGHSYAECKIRRQCFHCKKFDHNRALCPVKFIKVNEDKSATTNVFHARDKGFTILQTAIVTASKEGDLSKEIKCRVLLDSGSQRTYITQKAARSLRLDAEEESILTIFTFGTNTPQQIKSPVVRVQLRTRANKTITLSANVVPVISHRVPYPRQDLSHWKDTSKLADDGSLQDQVDILIGNDYYFSLISEQKTKLKENLYMVQSDLGWILSGKTDSSPIHELSIVTYFQSNLEMIFNEPDLPLVETNMKNLWDLESIGITDSPRENREDEAVRKFNQTTEYMDNRYFVSWPWIEYPPALTMNFGLAYGRLVNLLKRLDISTLSAYDETLKDQRKKGIIEVAPDLREQPVKHPVHYLPHYGVKVPDKPMRIVYDASSKTKDNKSLNQCLYCGPMMLEDLTGLLVKFRCQPIGVCADVEKAFLQIALKEPDRDVTRFLWLKNIEKPATEDNLLHLRFTRVPFGIISSPFLLNATIRLHLRRSNNEQIRKRTKDIYVDNVVTGTKTLKEALQLYKGAKETFKQLSMNLREWSSNSEELIKQIPDSCKEEEIKVLGLNWNLKEDTLRLKCKTISGPNTKRGVLRVIASIYDPCGFAVPSLLSSKLFIQNLWKEKIKWDTPFSETFKADWSKINNELEEIREISLPRCYFSGTTTSCQIHCFTDSSTKAYAAVIYIVNDKEVKFVLGKSRLIPVKDQDKLKIPRLELLGVLIGTRLINYVSNILQFDITRQILWTDSQIVIDWCRSDKLLTPFVARRVEEIKRNKDLMIRHVPSELNPADVATRPFSSKEDKVRWLTGPQFILQHPDSWPSDIREISSLCAGEGLPKESQRYIIDTEKTTDTKNQDIDRKSNQSETEVNISETKGDKIKQLKKLQAEYFPRELEGKETSLKLNLGLFLDVDGVLRCKGRLKNTDWSYDQRYPILISKDCEYTNKVITQTHSDNHHVGVNHTLAIIRQSFWIPQGKRQVQKIIRKCLRCEKHGGGPFKLPSPPALPIERVNFTSPFTFTVLDYMGPVLVKHENETSKRWIALFTCLAVRAVHLEVVQDLTAEEGIHALRRMISTRGVPQLITSDNATNFKLMSEILSDSYCIKREIRWRFIPQLAPWFGGFYERLIGIVKNCMKRALEKHLLTDSQLVTMVKEIEATVNSRPLTCVDSELVHILKPSDFLAMGKCITTEGSIEDFLVQGTTTKSDLVKAWKRGLVILNEFKDMFSNRYLPSLRERYGHSVKEPRVTAKIIPKVGQVVQIKGDNKNREEWKVGKITSLVKSVDGLCRVAKVGVGSKEFIRSLAHLYPLEMEDNEKIEYEEKTFKKRSEVPQNILIPELIPMDVEVMDSENMSDSLEKEKENKESLTTTEENMSVDIDEVSESTDRGNIMSQNENEPEKSVQTNNEVRQRRGAATRALEKIAEWTRNLLTLL